MMILERNTSYYDLLAFIVIKGILRFKVTGHWKEKLRRMALKPSVIVANMHRGY